MADDDFAGGGLLRHFEEDFSVPFDAVGLVGVHLDSAAGVAGDLADAGSDFDRGFDRPGDRLVFRVQAVAVDLAEFGEDGKAEFLLLEDRDRADRLVDFQLERILRGDGGRHAIPLDEAIGFIGGNGIDRDFAVGVDPAIAALGRARDDVGAGGGNAHLALPAGIGFGIGVELDFAGRGGGDHLDACADRPGRGDAPLDFLAEFVDAAAFGGAEFTGEGELGLRRGEECADVAGTVHLDRDLLAVDLNAIAIDIAFPTGEAGAVVFQGFEVDDIADLGPLRADRNGALAAGRDGLDGEGELLLVVEDDFTALAHVELYLNVGSEVLRDGAVVTPVDAELGIAFCRGHELNLADIHNFGGIGGGNFGVSRVGCGLVMAAASRSTEYEKGSG